MPVDENMFAGVYGLFKNEGGVVTQIVVEEERQRMGMFFLLNVCRGGRNSDM